MTDKLIEQIKTDRERNAIGGGDRRRARTIEYEDRILADAEVIKTLETENTWLRSVMKEAASLLETFEWD